MKIDPHIIARYLDGPERNGDKEKILSWFSSTQEEGKLRQIYNDYWNDLPASPEFGDYDEEKMLGKIYHKIKVEETNLAVKSPTRHIVNRIVTIFSRIAAVLIIPLSIYMYLNRDRLMLRDGDIAYSEIYAPMGTRTRFSLPDGSSGYLNAGSSIKFPAIFEGRSRNINLKGEAFFDVRTNPQKPFIVSGENIKVIAYGTAFNVEVYSGDKNSKVTLVHGKVEVFGKKNNKEQKLGLLKPGEMCIYNNDKLSYEFLQVDANKVVSWKDGKLIFKNEPFSEVVNKLNRRYGVHLIIKDEKLRDYSYMATFEDETLDEVLKLLKISAPISIKDNEKVISPDGSFGERTIELYFKNNN